MRRRVAVGASFGKLLKKKKSLLALVDELVTTLAVQGFVFAIQREGSPVVIVTAQCEGSRAVALIAWFAEPCSSRLSPRGIMDVFVASGAGVEKGPIAHGLAHSDGEGAFFLQVALTANDRQMFPYELVTRIPIVLEVEGVQVKAGGGVTGLAACGELTQMNVLMTRPANGLERFVAHRFDDSGGEASLCQQVTLAAFYGGVLFGKRITRLLVGKKSRFEAVQVVATFAVDCKLPDMRVFLVAVVTPGKSDVPVHLLRMAAGAVEAPVHAGERIAGPTVVVSGKGPRLLSMTAPAIGAQTRLVRVLVAVDATGESQALPLFLEVTFFAGNPLVRASERISGAVMVKWDVFEADVYRVTLETILSKLAVVLIRMTCDTTSVVQKKTLHLLPRWRKSRLVTSIARVDFEMEAH